MSEGALPTILAGLLALALNAYVLFGGADFGGGVWDLLASGPRRSRQRDLVSHAIGPADTYRQKRMSSSVIDGTALRSPRVVQPASPAKWPADAREYR